MGLNNRLEKQYSNFRTITLSRPSNITPLLLKYANHALEKIYRPGFNYKRVGIMLTGLVPASTIQSDLFDTKDLRKLQHIQEIIDKINNRFSRDQVRFACQGFKKRWKMKQEKLSPRYTTHIKEILTVSF